MCWRGRTESLNNFRFSIADFGLGRKQVNESSWMGPLNFRSDNRKSAIQNPKWVGIFAIVVALTVCGAKAEAQQPAKIPRIGYLAASSLSALAPRTEAFRQGLRELGYMEGKNIVIEWRSTEGKADRKISR